jgi:hypothetical protein
MVEDLIELIFPGVGWLAIGVVVGSAFSSRLRPAAKEALKFGMAVGERVQGATAEAFERGQDLVAEARAEHAESEPVPQTAARGPRPQATG